MAKNTKNTSHSRRQTAQERFPLAATILFLSGCAAEAYILFVLRYFVNGSFRHVAAGSRLLPILSWMGAALCMAGVIGCIAAWTHPFWRKSGLSAVTGGVVFSLLSFLGRYSPAALTALSIAVPAVTLLGILWLLYDRECAFALTALGGAVIVAWVCYRGFYSYPTLIRWMARGFLLLLSAAAYLFSSGRLKRVLPPKTNPLPVGAALALSAAGVLATFLGRDYAYYAMWTLAFLIFGLAVYYTVKQL